MLKSVDRLNRLKNFKYNWNGYGGHTFDSDFINDVIELVKQLNVEPSVYPTGRSTVSMEYELDSGWYLGFEVSRHLIKMLFATGEDGVRDYKHYTEKQFKFGKEAVDRMNLYIDRFFNGELI